MVKVIFTLEEINLLWHNNPENTKAVTRGLIPELDEVGVATLTYNKKPLIDTVIKEWYAECVKRIQIRKYVVVYVICRINIGTLLGVGYRIVVYMRHTVICNYKSKTILKLLHF